MTPKEVAAYQAKQRQEQAAHEEFKARIMAFGTAPTDKRKKRPPGFFLGLPGASAPSNKPATKGPSFFDQFK